MQDWKDLLLQLQNDPSLPQGADTAETAPIKDDIKSTSKRKLTIFYERKGRGGKEATIIDGFDPDDVIVLQDTARTLKQKIGCGGSARGSEILLQGDRRKQAADLLRKMGFII